MQQKPSVGRIVHYVLSEDDADRINKRRDDVEKDRTRTGKIAGPWAPVGNLAGAGQVLPLLIVRVWSDILVNGQVHLDGNDLLWKTSATLATDGPTPGCWSWPERV